MSDPKNDVVTGRNARADIDPTAPADFGPNTRAGIDPSTRAETGPNTRADFDPNTRADFGDADHRQNLMQRDVLLMVIAGLSLVNGMHFSPYFDPAFLLLRPFAAGIFVTSPLVLLYLTSLFVSILTVAVGGVPAALIERARGHKTSTPGTLMIWAAGVAAVTAPTMLGLGG